MNGYIKYHRSITKHWIYEPKRPKTYREAWEDILITVNWEPKRILIKGQLIHCDRGQSLNSLQSWAKLFNWTIGAVRHFFKILERDQMITTEGLQYTTRLTVCNWDIYQIEATDEEQTESTTKNKPNATTKEDKEYKEEMKEGNQRFTPPSLNDIQKYFTQKLNEKGLAINPANETEKFESFYSSKGWYVGKNKMKDWKKAVSGWISRIEPDLLNGKQKHQLVQPLKGMKR